MGSKKLKAVALRGLGMLDAGDPGRFYSQSKSLLEESPAEKGFGPICRRLGCGDLDQWLKPLMHRYRSCFACPYACNTFVKYNEDPAVFESTDVEEPGMLVTSAAAALWLKDGGWGAEPACRAMELMAREGLDLLRGARALSGKPLDDTSRIEAAVKEIGQGQGEKAGWPGEEDVGDTGPFGPWVPPLEEREVWLAANRAGYVLGVCPVYLLLSGLDLDRLFSLCPSAAGLEISLSAVEGMLD